MALLRGGPDNMPEGIYNNADTYTGSGTSEWSAAVAFTKPCKEVVLTAKVRGGKFKLSPDGTNWTDEIHVIANTALVIPFDAHSFKVKRSGSHGSVKYVVQGFYQE